MKLDQQLLDEVADCLSGGGRNYAVFLRLYQVSTAQTTDSQECIREALGQGVVVGGIEDVSAELVCSQVEASLRFAGDEAAGPCRSLLSSDQLQNWLTEVQAGLLELAGTSRTIQQFWLQEGHPAYPVFWDFGFLFFRSETISILVGASSD
ncbi:hypothetical protein [Ralstonia pseudosolanacearum]|uniref:hypothetical protein n=1 Tax=Ralstonia pseudosolanacearum TaxID=1310165 RepID=UPI0011B75E74|nr:hypothetical protein [Ralstonia pseudosolanacearum]MCK4152876.1 hypothetical protein [Ralstonia pseudosolanacearum]QIK21773.1 hypothetical protein G7968_26005 [Ralstonia solanacearum]